MHSDLVLQISVLCTIDKLLIIVYYVPNACGLLSITMKRVEFKCMLLKQVNKIQASTTICLKVK